MPMFNATATIFTMHEGKNVDKSIQAFQLREMAGAMKAFLKACVPKIPVRTGFLRAAFKPMRRMFMGGSEGADLDQTEFSLYKDKETGRDVKLAGLAGLLGANLEITKAAFERAAVAERRSLGLSEAGMKAHIVDQERASRRRWRKTKAGRAAGGGGGQEWYYYGKGQRVPKTPSNAIKLVTPADPGEVIKVTGLRSEIKFDINISYYRINDFYARIAGSPWRSLDAGFQASLNYLEKAARRYPYLSEVLATQRIYLRGTNVGTEPNQAADYRGRFGGNFYD